MSDSRQLAWFFATLFLAAAACVAWWGCATLRQALTNGYSQTEGVVLDSSLIVGRNRHGNTYDTRVTYSYNVAGQEYTSDRFALAYSGPEEGDHDWVQAHPTGGAVTVYYDPSHPETSVLRRGVIWNDFVALACSLAALFVAGGVLAWILNEVKAARQPGGLTIFRLDDHRHGISLTGNSEFIASGAVGAVVVLAATIAHGIASPASFVMLLVCQTLVIALALAVSAGVFTLLRRRRRDASRMLVVDQAAKTLRVPASERSSAAMTFAFAAIQRFEVEQIKIQSGSRTYTRYRVLLVGPNAAEARPVPVHALASEAEAASLAAWLEEAVGVPRRAAEPRAMAG
ncbi:MAG: DUF3592 domain-containing protein [Phycisphaerales bacterium]